MVVDLRSFVRERAGYRCEYCLLPEKSSVLPMQIDHIIALQHGGSGAPENLALACCYCNRFKGPNVSGIDPATGQLTPLFNPRVDEWNSHFAWHGPLLTGRTGCGRTTIRTLQINHPEAVAVRNRLIAES